MKVIFLIRSLNYGGAERQLVTLARRLHQRGHEVRVAVFYPGGPLEVELQRAGVPVVSLDKRSRWDLVGFLFKLVSLLHRVKPNLVYGYLVVPNLLLVFLKSFFPQIRIVWGVRDSVSVKDLSRYDWLVRLTFRASCLLARYADLIIVNSWAGLVHYRRCGYPSEKMVVIPNGIDTDYLRPDPAAGRRVREEWGIGEDEKLIAIVGRLDPVKGHPTFLKAAELLVKERDDVRFVCVGDGSNPYKTQLCALGRELGLDGRLIWAGVRADMPAVYSALSIVCSSSYTEGFPNVIGEAMACGVPCVVTDVGDSVRIVGDTGVVVPPKNPEALASGWKVCLARDRSQTALKARLRIVENFSVKRLVEQTEQAICTRG